MKKIILCAIICIMCLTVSVTVSAMAPDLQTMDGPHYLMDERFGQIMTMNNSPVISGWDVDVSGGSIIGYQQDEWFRFRDESKAAPVSMSKKIAYHDKGVLTLETSIKFSTGSNGLYFRLAGDGGEKDIALIQVQKGALYLIQKNDMKQLMKFKLNQFFSVKLDVNLDNRTVVVHLGGKRIGSFDFKDDVNNLDFIEFKSTEENIAEFYMNGLIMYTGFALNEQFFSYADNTLSDEWRQNKLANSVVQPQRTSGKSWPDCYSLHINDVSNVEGVELKRNFNRITGRVSLEGKFTVIENKQNFNMAWTDGSKPIFNVGLINNCFTVNGMEVYECTKDVWYDYIIDVDFFEHKADIYINSRLIAENISFSGDGVDGFFVTTEILSRSEFWIDDIRAFLVNEPEEYVPEPEKVESDDFLLGMQTCDMWREGQHLGWDFAYADPDRHPYLGFYDEGSREAADWQNKWMIEHGVDFRLNCWFLPTNWQEGPILFGRNGFELREGYLRSAYSDRLDFMIMWENTSATKVTGESFRKYVVPYWVEHYLKDPRYLVVDNKPVISIYVSDYFFKYQCNSSEEEAKINIQCIRDACKELGYDDAIILTSRSGESEMYADKIGADGIHNYSFAISEFGNGGQIENLRKTKTKHDNIFVAGAVSQGREESAWLRNKGAYEPVDGFKKTLEYVRDEHYQNYEQYPLSEKLCFLLTWNEYCEGHYIAPCGLEGFGYLDAISDVFTNRGAHTDVVPEDAEKQDFGILFQAEGREPLMHGEDATLPIPEKVVKKWEGDSLALWTAQKQIENYRYEDGKIKGTAIGMDPSIVSEENLDIDLTGISYIRIRLKQSVTARAMSIFFITDTDQKWNEAKGITLTPEATNEEFYDVYFPVWIREPWKGKLVQLRIDPFNTTGEFEIESVELLKDESGGLVRFELDGQEIAAVSAVSSSSIVIPEVPIKLDGTVYLSLTCIKKYADMSAIYVPDEKCIKLLKNSTLLTIDTQTGNAYRNGKAVGKALIQKYNGRWIIGVRNAAEFMGYEVMWKPEENKVVLKSPPMPVSLNADPIGSWNFNEDGDLQKWSPNNQISSVSVSDGIMYITASNSSPTLSMSGLSLDTAKYTTLKFRLKNGTKNGQTTVYFTTDLDTTANEAKKYSVVVESQQDNFSEYEIDLTENPNWKGNLKWLRFDPVHGVGDVELDYIILTNE
ncbi:MAG: hypothetical protein IKW59_06825 [Clostridia bacterium]|nr:hypothetical protein [Clostridia bacterium]